MGNLAQKPHSTSIKVAWGDHHHDHPAHGFKKTQALLKEHSPACINLTRLILHLTYVQEYLYNGEVWTNGLMNEYVPKHREVVEVLAKKILRTVVNNPPEPK